MRSVTFELEQADLQAAIVQSIWTRRLSINGLARSAVAPLLLAVVVFYMLANGGADAPLPWAFLAFVAFAATTLLSEMLAATMQARVAAKNPLYTHEQTFAWDGDGVRISSSRGETRLRWGDLAGFAESRRVLLLYLPGGKFQPLPRRLFTEAEWNDLRAALTAAAVPNFARWH